MEAEFSVSNSSLLMAWLFSLVFTVVSATIGGFFPARLERARKFFFPALIFPGLIVALIYAARGFGILERPLVHWVFEKTATDALRLGLIFDPLSLVVAVFGGVATSAICFKNGPTIRMCSALALSWAGLGLAATSQTLWMATLGMGIQLLSRTLPLIENISAPLADDARWIASSKRAWIGLAIVLCGGSGLAAQGVHLDFFSVGGWSTIEGTPSAIVAGALLIFGLMIMAAPAFASSAIYSRTEIAVQENLSVSETSLAWISIVVFYRLLGNIHDPQWLLAVGIGGAVATAGSLAALTFQTSRSNAIHLWLATFPVSMLMVLPFVPAREAHLYLVGGFIAANGLWIALDHRRSKLEISFAAAFLLGAFGFTGWSTAAGFTSFFSKFETDSFFRAPILILLLFYSAIGWRLVIRGGDRESTAPAHIRWATLGVFFVFAFGPLISGRWGAGALPEEADWLEGAKAWPWIKAGTESPEPELTWLGFGITHGIVAISSLIGIFAWKTSELFPFAKKYPRGARAAEGLFGLVWIESAAFGVLQKTGSLLSEKVSSPVWERIIPRGVVFLFSVLRRTGSALESGVDPITSGAYGRIFTPAAKLVQWLHGGNVRLYAWFALIWILIFSVYLTR